MSSIQVVKSSMRFQTATERPRCGNCRDHEMQYAERMPPFDRSGMRCKKGGFQVSAYAVCNQHQPERLAAAGV